MNKQIIIFNLIALLVSQMVSSEWSTNNLDLPDSHITRFLNSFKEEAEKCASSDSCVFQNILNTGLCWGYENKCPKHLRYSDAKCPNDHKGWVTSKSQQLNMFDEQADFGFIKQQIKTKTLLCEPKTAVSIFLNI